MYKTVCSRASIFLSVGVILCAEIGSAQSCPSSVSGFYSYTAIGNGVPSALLVPGTTTGTGTTATGITGTATTGNAVSPSFSTTGIGQLVSGATGSVPFASSGKLYFDGAGSIFASSTQQFTPSASSLVGTYTLNSDCTISVILNDAFGSNTTKLTLQGVILGDGSEIDLGVLQTTSTSSGTGTNTGTSNIAPGLFQSNILIRLVRPFGNSCNTNTLAGARTFIVASGTRTGTGTGTGTVTGTPFFIFGRVQFDGNGNLFALPSAQSSIGRQFAGTYTVNSDCTGTVSLNSTTSTTAGSIAGATPALALNFVMNASATSSTPQIQFTQSSGTQLLLGSGQVD